MPRRRSVTSPPLRAALALLGAALLALGLVEAVLLLDQEGAPWVLALFPAAAAVWFAAGAVAALRRPGNAMGPIMLAGALAWLLAGLGNAPLPAPSAVGLVVAALPLALVAHLLHAFPSGRLRGTASRAIVAGLYVAALVLQAPAYLFRSDGAGAPLTVAERPDLVELGGAIQDGVGGGLMLATAVLLGLRLRAAAPAQRRVLAPLVLYGIAAVVLVPLLARLDGPLLGGDPIALFAAQAVLAGLVPVAFAGALLRGGFARAAGVRELDARLDAGAGDGTAIRTALADALGDRSVALLLRSGAHGGPMPTAGSVASADRRASGSRPAAAPEPRAGWIGLDGRPAAAPPDPRSGRGVVTVDADGVAIGAIVYDAELIADAQPVRDAARVIAAALERERLTAELLASRERLRESRARIAAAADAERRRIARDLHDGLQGRLVLLGLRAQELEARAGDPTAVRDEGAALRQELAAALAALRELVQGVLPAALVERGLGAAAEDLADRMPVPTTVDAVADRFPPAVESAGWFVIAEALANAAKHAQARSLEVVVARREAGLRVEVVDDGVGGADANGSGTGLAGLADRLDVLGGRLLVESPPGAGTRIVAEVPCAS